MKQEVSKKSKKWLWLVIAIVAVLAVVGVVLGIVLSGSGPDGDTDATGDNAPKGGRADLYWNIDREQYGDPTTGMSSREPGKDGKYHITFAHEGEQVEYVVADKRLVNFIDTVDAMGLVFDDAGNVIEAIDVNTIAKEMAKSFYVVKVEGNVITLNGSATLDGLTKQITCEELTKIYNFAGARETKGEIIQPEDVQPLDTVLVYGNDLDQATHFGVMFSPVESAIYWRVQQFYNYAVDVRSTTRIPDENGIYTVEMFCNGELLPLKFKVKEAVDAVDKVTSDICHFGLIFDEDGYVIGTQASQLGIRGRIACNQYDVTEINGANFTATRVVGGGNDVGNTYTGVLPEGVPVYNASAHYLLEERGKNVGSLQIGDRITVWEDTLGNIVEIYIYNRIRGKDMYFKMDAVSNRKPNEDGWYTFEIFNGKAIEIYKTKNEPLCRFIEQNKFFGMQVAAGNVIEDAWGYTAVVGHGYVDYARYNYSVSSVAGIVVALTSPDAKTLVSKIMSPTCKVYNMSGIHQELGAETTIQPGDRGWFISDASGQMVIAYISERKVDAGVYYNLSRRYDGANKCTARTPDEDGYYVFTMAHEGKQVTIKTKSKAVASKIDEVGNCIVGLNPNSKGIVTDAYRGTAATGGQTQAGGEWTFECYTEDGRVQLYKPSAPESKYYFTPADDMKTFNVAAVGFKKFRGEADTLEVGDRVLILTDANAKTVIAYIIGQTFDDVTRMCEHCNKKVTFKPWLGTNFSLLEEASGHYYIPGNGSGCSSSIMGDVPKEKGDEIIIDLNGKTMEFAEGQRGFLVYNEVHMHLFDSVGGGKLVAGGQPGGPGGVVTVGGFGGKLSIYSGTYELTEKHQSITAGGVINMNGSYGTTINLYGGKLISNDPKMEALYVNNGTVNMESGFVIDGAMVVGGNAEVNMSGKIKITKMEINKGKLIDFTKLNKKSSIGIVARGVFTTEMSKPESWLKVFSCPVKGGKIVVEGKQLACYGTEPDYSQVYEQSLKMDFSDPDNLPTTCPFCDRGAVWEPLPEPDLESKWGNNVVLGGGKHYYLDKNRSIEGVYMLDGGDVCLHLNGKTITSTGREIFTIFAGKTLAVMGKGTMKGSGNSEGGYIASVISNNGGLNLCGGTYVATSKGNMPIIANRGDEGNEVNVYDGTIKTDGVAIKARMRSVTINGGTVNGMVTTETSTIGNASVVITGGTAENVKVVAGSTLELSGKPVVKKLTIAKGILAKVGTLKSGAKIAIDADGVFTTNFASEAAAKKALKYFTVAEEGASLRTEGKALFCEPAPFNYKAVIKQANAMKFPTDSTVYTADCPYCEESVQWTPLSTVVDRYSETNERYEQFLYDTRHYYADKNFTLKHAAIQNVTAGAPCVHLNGKTITGVGKNVFTTQMTIMGNGTVTVTKAADGTVPDKVVHPNGGIMNIFGGTYTTAKDVYLSGGESAIFPFHGGKNGTGAVNFYGGEIKAINSDAVKVWNNGTFNMYGGKITGRPVNVHNAGMEAIGTVNIYGGSVENIVANDGALNVEGGTIGKITVASANVDSLKLSGAPKITELKFLADLTANATGLTTGASIGINKVGVFTTDFASEAAAKTAKKYFSAVQDVASIEVQGKALACVGGTAPAPDEPAPEPDPDYDKEAVAQIITQANAMSFPANGSDKTAECPHCKKTVTWVGLTEGAVGLASGHYYLANDIIASSADGILYLNNQAGASICLHLNGKTIANDQAGNMPAIRVWSNNNSLNIMGDGVVSTRSMNWAALDIAPSVDVNIYGGKYDNAYGNRYAINAKKGNTFIYNAEITTGKLNITNGSGNVYIYDGYFPNVVIASQTAKVSFFGGGYGTVTASGALTVKGGNVTKITATENAAKLTVSDKAIIKELDMTACNILLTVGELKSGASIKVKAKEGVFTKDFESAAAATAAKAFFTGISGEIKVEGKALAFAISDQPAPEPEKLTPAQIIAAANTMSFPADGSNYTAKCPACGEGVIWRALKEATSGLDTGHYYLANDIITSNNGAVLYMNNGGGARVCLHLNGKTVANDTTGDMPAIRVWSANNSLNLMGNGNVTTASTNWGALDINPNVEINVYGGTFTNAKGNRRAINVKNGTVNIYSATIENGWINATGGVTNIEAGTYEGVVVNNANATINVKGGTIGKLNATVGKMNVTGGTVTTLTVAGTATELKLSGTPVINELDMTAATIKLTVGELKSGADIKVKANNGVFTADFATEAAATAAKAFISGINGEIKVEGKALSFTGTSGGGTEPPAPGPGTDPDPDQPLTPAQIVAAGKAMTFQEGNIPTTCPKCGDEITWLAMTEEMINTSTTRQYKGHYYLAEDIEFTTEAALAINATGKLCLHLNGKSFSSPTTGDWNATIRGNTELNIFDNGNGSINGNASAAIWANCTVNIYGGTYTATNANAVFELRANNETINFYDGQVTSGDVRMNGANAAFKMYGGEYTGTGKIKGNNTFTGMIAGIYENAKFSATGGITTYYINVEVTGGEVSKIVGGASTQSIKISGDPVITELDVTVSGTPMVEVGTLTGGSIGVKANGVFTTDFADEAAAKAAKTYFSAVASDKGITVEGKALTCIDASLIPPEVMTPEQIIAAANAMTFPADGTDCTATCPVCKESVTWKALSAATTGLASGHYYLANDIIDTNTSGILYMNKAGGAQVCLNLNGKTLENTTGDMPAIRVWSANNSLNLMGNGNVTTASTNWGALDINPNVEINVYGGTFTNAKGNRRAINVKNGTVNIYSATIENGWINVTGGTANIEGGSYEGVNANNANATVNVKSGTIDKLTATAGTLSITGGTITKMTVADTAGTTTISGAPVITTLDMSAAGDKKLTIGELTEGTAIGVKAADGAFTTAFADADAAKAAKEFFTALDEGKAVTVKENALAIVDASEIITDPNAEIIAKAKAVTAAANAMSFEGTGVKSAVCPLCGDEAVSWQPLSNLVDKWSETNQRYEQFLGNLHYYADADLTLTHAAFQTVNGTPCVFLNNKTLTGVGCQVFTGSMNLMGKGKVMVAAAEGVTNPDCVLYPNNSTMSIYGGEYTTAANVTLNGALINNIRGGIVNLYGGKFVSVNDPAIAVRSTNSSKDSTFNMYGGEVLGEVNYGANANVCYANICGGTVNKLVVNAYAKGLTVSGAAVIKELDMSAATIKLTVNTLVDGAEITVKADDVFTTEFASNEAVEAAKAYFKPAFGKEISVVEKTLKCADRTEPYTTAEIIAGSNAMSFTGDQEVQGVCYKCMQPVTWKPMTEAPGALNGGGHYFLANEITSSNSTGAIYLSGSGTLCLHLNGKSITQTGGTWPAIRMWSSNYGLNLMGDGLVTSNASNWGALSLQGGKANIYGGRFSNTGSNYDAAIMCRSSEINIYDATVVEGNLRISNYNNSAYPTVAVHGGTYPTVNAVEPNATITIKGGTFTTFNAGGNVTIEGGTFTTLQASSKSDSTNFDGYLTVKGGTIEKLVATEYTKSIALSDNPVITNLDMTASPVKATIGTLTEGASIGVTAEGVFTNDIADVNAAKAFFSAVVEGKTIAVVEQTLSCVNAA